ncbi:nuclear transport factor 2 family protein [Methylosinus sp. H3A]|uniref:nuclear transport factor 2 family protein n=1 Tax=Methylosinus sp. H3A TaxID=2785786 RepID=UPI0018C27105|nr:nuclear transport factor 2 family protein [Methylosinus sp. H3A]MBG0810196.1 nuclear transport factor 2 family protein [Methylosinus sp. H3A]
MQPKIDEPDEEHRRELRRNVFEITRLRMAGRIDEMMRYFARDVVVRYHGTKEGLFLPGVLHGRDAFKENIRLTDVNYEPLGGEVLDILVDGERTVVRWRNSWRHRNSGRTATLDMAHFLYWRNGKVVELLEYLDYHGLGRSAAEALIERDEP